jgi:hypothetical protein
MSDKIKQSRRGSVVGTTIFGFMGLIFGALFVNSLYNRDQQEFVWALGSAVFLAISVALVYALLSTPSDESPIMRQRLLLLILIAVTTAVVLAIGFWAWGMAVPG